MRKPAPETISISGYKSIRSLTDLRLSPGLNVLVGANGAGKSNFLRFFEMLGHMMDPVRGLQRYVAARGRADAFLFRGTKVTKELSARVAFGLNAYEFTLRPADDRSLFFETEAAPFDGPKFGAVVNGQGTGHLESRLAAKDEPTKAEEFARDTIRSWRVHHFHDTSATAGMMGLANIADNRHLHSDASNVAAFLLRLSEQHPRHFRRIEETVRQVAPFFGAFVLDEQPNGKTQLLWRDRHAETVYYPSQLSDGTARYICLAALLLQPDPPPSILIDEPELGMHPVAIGLVASLLNEAAERSQVIVSTQSVTLLDQFQPEDLIVVDQRDGESIIARPSVAKIEQWLEAYSLGQIWVRNHIGGLP
ncbi:MAG: AAA family ATPase [Sandaracinaceae bacterium]|nr:AAA family ATPase [Sandaracinaceae bacterium]